MQQLDPHISQRTGLDRYVLWGIGLSALVHLSMAMLLARQTPPVFDTPVMVELVSEPSMTEPKHQLVSPSNPTEQQPSKPTSLEGERDSATEREQIRRGDPLAGPVAGDKSALPPAPQTSQRAANTKPASPPKHSSAAPSSVEPKPQSLAAAQPLKDLLLDPDTMLRSFGAPSKKAAPSENPLLENSATLLSAYEPFSRPSGSGARFLGTSGSNDYLPSLPDGDITLLNAKANRYAVFVRRVATQVFTALRTQGWEMLRAGDIRAVTRFSMVEATLSPRGALLNVAIRSGSGSQRFDALVHSAAQSGARDSNPPAGALASDGNIHFIFQAQSWVEVVPGARTGFPTERRWLLLGTGLE